MYVAVAHIYACRSVYSDLDINARAGEAGESGEAPPPPPAIASQPATILQPRASDVSNHNTKYEGMLSKGEEAGSNRYLTHPLVLK